MIKACLGMPVSSSIMAAMNIRFPRILAAIITGAGLAAASCVMQNILNNPLASPSTLGISNAATLGANVAIIIKGIERIDKENNSGRLIFLLILTEKN